MPTRTIVVVGGLLRRHISEAAEIPEKGETIETTKPFQSHTGGRGAFAAVAAHRLSHLKPPGGTHKGVKSAFKDLEVKVHLVATVGDDDTGKDLIEKVKKCGVNADQVQTTKDASTSMAMVIVDSTTKHHRTWYDAGANHTLQPKDFKEQSIWNRLAGGTKPDLIVTNLELLTETTEQLIDTAGKAKVDVLLNLVPVHVVLNRVMQHVTHLIIHKAEARRFHEKCPKDSDDPKAWGKLAQTYLDSGVKNVVITLGAQGAYFANKFVSDVVPTQKRDVNDKIGGA
ncbi:MAG: hypothetical protein LQ342_001224 [Letrouitia transgressa]|nr:MAG: hypothetical protein LQ342_001224 [Letrouitia transgressa]